MRIGIDLGGTKTEIIALSLTGETLLRERVPTPKDDYLGIVATVASLVEMAEEKLGSIPHVGIGIPGSVAKTGLIKNANTTVLIGKPFQTDLEAKLGRPVRLANDANCFTLSEAVDGAAASYHSVFGVILGTGCGGGIVIDGKVHVGVNAIAGEWGHNPLPYKTQEEEPGPLCYCKRLGCIETFISGTGFSLDYQKATGHTLSGHEIEARAQAGDPKAQAALSRLCERIAKSLGLVINILDPDCIVMGGGLSNLSVIYDEVPRRLGAYVFSDRVDTKLVKAHHGDSSGVRGAAWLWPA